MSKLIHCCCLLALALFLTPLGSAQNQGGEPLFPNTNAKDMDGSIPWRVQDHFTPIPVLWIIKDSDQALVEVDELHYVALYDVTDGTHPPGNWDSPGSSHLVYLHDFNDMEVDQDYWYWLTTSFENDGSHHGAMADGTAFTASNLGYGPGDTICFTLRLYGTDGIWPFYTDVTLDQDFKVHVGEAPLPTLPNWYIGDVHNHGWHTDNLYEYADPIAAKALAAAAMGLSYVTVTDHASDLNTSKWNDLGSQCALYSTPTLRLIRGQELHANQGGLADVRHMLGYGQSSYIVGDEDGTYSINEILGGPDPSNHLAAQGAFAYAAHPTDPSLGWSYSEMEQGLAHPTLIGLEFLNEKNAFLAPGDEYHPWGGSASTAPHNQDWVVTNNGWRADLDQGLRHWDHLMSDRLDPVRKIFGSAGSDAHGGWNYRIFRNTSNLEVEASSNAMGKVRTVSYLPQGLNEPSVLTSLREGRTFFTDGPALIFGIDKDGDGNIYGPTDAIIGDGPVQVGLHNPKARFRFLWNSSPEIGEVVCIRLYRGSPTTGEVPELVHQSYPNSYSGESNSVLLKHLLPASGETVYFRAEAYTFDPSGPGAPPQGDLSNASYDALTTDYDYRCYTNPIWVTAKSKAFKKAPARHLRRVP